MAETGDLDALLDRLDGSTLRDSVKDFVLAAVVGDEALDVTVGGGAAPVVARASEDGGDESPPTFLAGIEATGFRGIGNAARLGLKPAPGLTLVVGRNGAGKSTFVDATEGLAIGKQLQFYAQ